MGTRKASAQSDALASLATEEGPVGTPAGYPDAKKPRTGHVVPPLLRVDEAGSGLRTAIPAGQVGGQPPVRTWPRIGRSSTITQTLPATAWSFDVQEWV